MGHREYTGGARRANIAAAGSMLRDDPERSLRATKALIALLGLAILSVVATTSVVHGDASDLLFNAAR